MSSKKIIVISAVNLVVGGTLTILKSCLSYLSTFNRNGDYRVVALVNNKEVAFFPNIEYVEIPWAKKSWCNRLWCEYVTMRKISIRLKPVYLWISMHDTSPNVIAKKRVVYCHNAFPFYNWSFKDLFFDYKIVMFSIFSKYYYKINIKKNSFVIVQQDWFKKEFVELFGLDSAKVVVLPPNREMECIVNETSFPRGGKYKFLCAGSSGTHKNFEIVCKAAENLAINGVNGFDIYLTLSGKESSYSQWLYKKYGNIDSVNFIGFQTREKLYHLYAECDCLLFPSKVESWGLPISEFAKFGKPMLVSNLPYAHNAAAGSSATGFFNPYKLSELEKQMSNLIGGDKSFLREVPITSCCSDIVSWDDLFSLLIER